METQKPPNPQIRGLKRQATTVSLAITSGMVRCSGKVHRSPMATSRAAVALDLPPSAMGGEANDGISNPRRHAARVAGHVRIGRRADCNSPSGRRVPRQRGGSISPFANALGPLIPSSLEPAPNCATRVVLAKHGHDGAMPSSADLSACAALSADKLIVKPA